jgi:flagellar protein FlaJ
MEVVKRNEKKRQAKGKFKPFEPSQSILHNNILKTIMFSLIGSISVLSMSFYFSEYSNICSDST